MSELSEKELALLLIRRMDDRTSLRTIAYRLEQLHGARELAKYFVENNLIDLDDFAAWVQDYANQWTAPKYAQEPPTPDSAWHREVLKNANQ